MGGKLDGGWVELGIYAGFQTLGGFAAGLFMGLYAMDNGMAAEKDFWKPWVSSPCRCPHGVTPHIGIGAIKGLFFELIATFFFMLVILSVAVFQPGKYKGLSGALVGSALTMNALSIGGITGAALNPARWLGPT